MSGGGAGAGAGVPPAAPPDLDDEEVEIIEGEKTEFLPPPAEIGFFDPQSESLCALHSVNNALGLNVFTRASINKVARRLVNPLNELQASGVPPVEVEDIFDALWGTTSGFTPLELAFLLFTSDSSFYLRQMSRSSRDAQKYTFQPSRRYIVLGDYVSKTGALLNSGHFVAVRKELVIDSNREAIEPYSIAESSFRTYRNMSLAAGGRLQFATTPSLQIEPTAWHTPNFLPSVVCEVVPNLKHPTLKGAMAAFYEKFGGTEAEHARKARALVQRFCKNVLGRVNENALFADFVGQG